MWLIAAANASSSRAYRPMGSICRARLVELLSPLGRVRDKLRRFGKLFVLQGGAKGPLTTSGSKQHPIIVTTTITIGRTTDATTDYPCLRMDARM